MYLLAALGLCAGHPCHPDLVPDLGDLVDRQHTFACAEEVFPSHRSITLSRKLVPERMPRQLQSKQYVAIALKRTVKTRTTDPRTRAER